MDDAFPAQLDLQIELTRDNPARERLHMLLLEAKERLVAQAEELAELRAGQAAAIDEALRRRVAAACKRVELSDPLGPELGAVLVLALVQEEWHLAVGPAPPGVDYGGQIHASWIRGGDGHEAWAPTREAAILAATAKLLDLDEASLRRRVAGSPAPVVRAAMALVDDWEHCRNREAAEQELVAAVEQLRGATAEEERETCGSCALWCRDGEPATDGGARPCGLDEDPEPAPRHAASSCARPGKYQRHPCVDCSGEPGECDYEWELFRCSACGQMVPFCKGAADDHPDLCDDCVAALPAADTDRAPESPPLPKGVSWPACNLLRSEGDQTEDYRCSTCGEHVSPEIFELLAGHCPSCGPTP